MNFLKVNKNKRIWGKSTQNGAAMLISVVFFLFISLAIISGLVSPTIREYKNSTDLLRSRQSFFVSESGVEDAYFRLKLSKPIGSSTSITLNGATATTAIVNSGFNEKTITTLGNVDGRERTNEVTLSTGDGVSFGYGVQAGVGGFYMGSNSVVNGSVYSNGTITGAGSITGTAASANTSALAADQTNDSGIPDSDITFGNANSTQDFAQSFQISTTDVVNKVDLYLKKVSTPGNLTVRIVNNSGGSPGTTTLASGSLSASLISTTYGWVSVPLSTNPQLNAGTTYWIVVDGTTNSSRYYFIGANNSYASGTGKVGQYSSTWSNTTPADLDGYFRLYLGGIGGLIDGITVGSGGAGNAYAHTVTNSTVAGNNYCQVGSGNNKPCDTTLPDPTQVAMPISDQNILDWKVEAEAGGTYTGNYIVDDDTTSLGPKKITGDMTIRNNADLTMTGILWVQGNLTVSNNATVRLAPDYGTSEGVIVVDGIIDINNNSDFIGSGSSGSYLMVLSTSNSTSAITLENNGGAVILYAHNGTVNLSNNSGARALNGFQINLANNSVIIYDTGLANSNFVNGPSGGWNINTWEEIE